MEKDPVILWKGAQSRQNLYLNNKPDKRGRETPM